MVSQFSRKLSSQFPALFFSVVIITLLLFCPFATLAWDVEINKVHDGDTIEVSRKGREVDVRFYGIDCPEKDQPYGMTAKKYVSRMIQDRDVEVEPSGEDQYGRVIGLVYVDGKLLNEALIMNGFAWVYDRYCNKRICDKWKRLEKKAREANGYANNFVNRKSEKSGSPLRQESTGGYNL